MLAKGLRVLEAAATRRETTLAELAEEVGLPKATAHRILGELVSLGYVERSTDRQYRLAADALRLVPGGRDRLLAAAESVLQRLWRQTQETVNLGELSGSQVRYLRVLACPLPLRRDVAAGSVDPALTTALGRVLAAHLPDERRAKLLARRLRKLTPRTETDPRRLAKVLAAVRRDGFAVEQDETDVGVACVAAPVLDRGVVSAAISVSVPTARLEEQGLDELRERVVRAAATVTQRLRRDRRGSLSRSSLRSTR